MPGSITTGTAPRENRAKAEAMRGRPWRTIRRVRSPGRTPAVVKFVELGY
jgi:hypothetical protein